MGTVTLEAVTLETVRRRRLYDNNSNSSDRNEFDDCFDIHDGDHVDLIILLRAVSKNILNASWIISANVGKKYVFGSRIQEGKQ